MTGDCQKATLTLLASGVPQVWGLPSEGSRTSYTGHSENFLGGPHKMTLDLPSVEVDEPPDAERQRQKHKDDHQARDNPRPSRSQISAGVRLRRRRRNYQYDCPYRAQGPEREQTGENQAAETRPVPPTH